MSFYQKLFDASFSMLDGPGGTGCNVPVHKSINTTYCSARSRWTKQQNFQSVYGGIAINHEEFGWFPLRSCNFSKNSDD